MHALQVMCCDYGFRSNSGRLYQEGYGQIPRSAWNLVSSQEQTAQQLLATAATKPVSHRLQEPLCVVVGGWGTMPNCCRL